MQIVTASFACIRWLIASAIQSFASWRMRARDVVDVASAGTPIGTRRLVGITQQVCIPVSLRTQHLHILGAADQGKAHLMQQMVLHDIDQGHGVAVIDPGGSLIESLLCRIPVRHLDRIIYLNFGAPDWVPIWNPLHSDTGQPPARIADALVRAFVRSGIHGRGKIGDVLHQAVLGVLHLSCGTFLDVHKLLRRGTEQGERFRQTILHVTKNQVAHPSLQEVHFISNIVAPVADRLGKLLGADTVGQMLSQPQSAISFQHILDQRSILLVDLSSVMGETGHILGLFILSLLNLAARSRTAGDASSGNPFHIYCDEAHRFLGSQLEGLMATGRKLNLSLTLAHPSLSQLDAGQKDAISKAGAAIMFRIDRADAAYLSSDLQGQAEAQDLTSLRRGEAIARIGDRILRIRAHAPLRVVDPDGRALIIRESHRRYYRRRTSDRS